MIEATPGELTRIIDIAAIDARPVAIIATPQECVALAARFDLVAVTDLSADVRLDRNGAVVAATGRLRAGIIQPCAISGEDLPVTIDQKLALRFVPAPARSGGEEMEVDAADCDEIDYHGQRFDLGEAVAQSLGLAIDPFLTGPNADRVRREVGLTTPEALSPFAALKKLGARKP